MASVLQMLRASAPTISVGVLTADLMNLGDQVRLVEEAGVSILHFDVMDGCFCPSMTVGPPFIKGVKTGLLKDVHLMISDPLTKIPDYVAAGADILTVHIECEPTHIHRVLQSIGKMTNTNDSERGIARGVALNPGTPVGCIEPLLDQTDVVTLLAINPGWSGQKFIPSTAERIIQARTLIGDRDILLCVDGGITKDNISDTVAMGADMVVTGSAVFDGRTPKENAEYMLAGLGRNK